MNANLGRSWPIAAEATRVSVKRVKATAILIGSVEIKLADEIVEVPKSFIRPFAKPNLTIASNFSAMTVSFG